MPFKVFNDGEVLTEADIDKFWIQQVHVTKTVDESVTNSITLQNDDQLVLPLLANTEYWLEIFLIYDTIQAADLRLAWTLPAGALIHWTHGAIPRSATSTSSSISRTFLIATSVGEPGGAAVAAGTNTIIMGEGRVSTGATPGNLQMQWAQFTASATPSVMKAGSTLILQRLTV